MHLFMRTLTLTGNPRDTMPWASSMTDYVNSVTSLNLTCWSSTFGFPVGTVIWSARIESQAQQAAATASLATDNKYFDLIEQARDMVAGPAEDRLVNVIHGTPGTPPGLGSVVQMTVATAVVDRMADAVAWSVDVAQHAESVTGYPVMVALDRFGQMGTVSWISSVPDMAAADDVQAKMAASPTYLDRLAATKGLFIPGSGHVFQAVRFA